MTKIQGSIFLIEASLSTLLIDFRTDSGNLARRIAGESANHEELILVRPRLPQGAFNLASVEVPAFRNSSLPKSFARNGLNSDGLAWVDLHEHHDAGKSNIGTCLRRSTLSPCFGLGPAKRAQLLQCKRSRRRPEVEMALALP